MNSNILTILIILFFLPFVCAQNVEIEGGVIIDSSTLNVDAINNNVVIGNTTTLNKFEVFVDSFFTSEINDQSSLAMGDPLLISIQSMGAQSFVANATGELTRIEIKAKKVTGDFSKLNLEIRSGNDPESGSFLGSELFFVTSLADSIYSVVFTTPITVTKNDQLVMILVRDKMEKALWQRSITDVYPSGNAFVNTSGWQALTQDHWFNSYIEALDSSIVPQFTVANNGNIGIGTTSPNQKLHVEGKVKITNMDIVNSAQNVVVSLPDGTLAISDIKASFKEELLDAGLNGFVEDIDGNKYKTIKIGEQVWMVDNLKTTRYNDGTLIPKVEDQLSWSALQTPGYCYQQNDSTLNAKIFGALYNWFAVADSNSLNVCPIGWHVPSDNEWSVLTDFLEDNGYGYEGSGTDIAKSMASTVMWKKQLQAGGSVGYEKGSNNSSGFSGIPAGQRSETGVFSTIYGENGIWWSSTKHPTNGEAWERNLYYASHTIARYFLPKERGFSVLCIRD